MAREGVVRATRTLLAVAVTLVALLAVPASPARAASFTDTGQGRVRAGQSAEIPSAR